MQDDEKMDKPSTPLKKRGAGAAPVIVDVQQKYTAVEDASGMDFRAMLKKKKYAKWKRDNEDPDWGDLKETEKEIKPQLRKVERASKTRLSPRGRKGTSPADFPSLTLSQIGLSCNTGPRFGNTGKRFGTLEQVHS
ncbi:hypothetical protein E2C01_006818 [Portunus trituberculatus]|uniref:Uncharacterized protein n=1 Tax=Portunus trituberculatus TaxID=210409 RepID=A0A5B7CYC3_PORTR|nr:hypothetical protein [Portunus trituberculatus]